MAKADDVVIGHDLARPGKSSKKFALDDDIVIVDETLDQVLR